MALSPIRSALGATLLPQAILGPFRPIANHPILQRCAEIALRPISITLPWSLADIWESVLRAVPKKKTSYSKKRSRQLAGKALKDVTTLNKCPGCGRVKRAHTLCIYCVYDVKQIFKQQAREMSSSEQPRSKSSQIKGSTSQTTSEAKKPSVPDTSSEQPTGVN